MDNKQQQEDEIEALSSIYGDDLICENETRTCFNIGITKDVKLFVTMNENYPSECPPNYLLQAPYLCKTDKINVDAAFSDIYLNHIGEPVIYEWIEKLKEIVTEKEVNDKSGSNKVSPVEKENDPIAEINENKPDFVIHHGDVITDRRSNFQGHACEVNSQKDVQSVMEQLLRNKKIRQATHNVLAYRIKQDNGLIFEDCDDDGETNAGSRLLHLLKILNVNNVIVIVTRWYGGILLGPDRFKHINNAARDALVRAKCI